MAFVLPSISRSSEDTPASLRACAVETADGLADLSWAVTLDSVSERLVPSIPRQGKEVPVIHQQVLFCQPAFMEYLFWKRSKMNPCVCGACIPANTWGQIADGQFGGRLLASSTSFL